MITLRGKKQDFYEKVLDNEMGKKFNAVEACMHFGMTRERAERFLNRACGNVGEVTEKVPYTRLSYRVVFDRKKETHKRYRLVQIEIYNRHMRKRSYVSTGVHLLADQFDRRGMSVVNHPHSAVLNATFTAMIMHLQGIENTMMMGNMATSPRAVRAMWMDKMYSAGEDVFEFADEVVENGERKESTKENMRQTVKLLKEFKSNLLFSEIDSKLVSDFKDWLANTKHHGINTQVKYMRYLKVILNKASEQGLVGNVESLYRNVSMHSENTKDNSLSRAEIKRIEDYRPKTRWTERVRDQFLFCLYTGLRYSDMKSMTEKMIVTDDNGIVWLNRTQTKTGGKVSVPLSKVFGGKAVALMEKYGGVEKLVRKANNTSGNRELKVIAKDCGIGLNVSFHLARHTFCSMLVAEGVSQAYVSRLMGHKSVRMTERYTTMLPEELIKQLDGVEAR